MTNDEAIAYFKRHIDLYCVDGICREAEETAIRALEQQPCDDAISRQAVLDRIRESIETYHNQYTTDMLNMWGLFTQFIKEMPPVTPQQKYGKWIKHPEIETSTPEYLMFYECSECGDKQCFCKSDLHKKRFCNSCGVKMQESEEV